MNAELKTIYPEPLRMGDTVGIMAPASPGDSTRITKAADHLLRLGLQVQFGKTVYNENDYGYLAGTDEDRARELNDMFANPKIKAIVCARGGYGTARMSDLLDYELIRRHPKFFWGYSDVTFLHNAIFQRTGLITFHGPMLTCLAADFVDPLTLKGFDLLFGKDIPPYTEAISPLEVLWPGTAEGVIVGGNLSLLVTTLGTPYEINTTGRLLLIEDIGEEPYRIDRMLNQLLQAGKLTEAAGIIVGDFHHCDPVKRELSLSLEEVIQHYIAKAGRPAMAGFRIGHCSPNIAIPLGHPAQLDTSRKLLQFG
ncbi:S66 peptidase family protein [Paenibacillus urinalis]|uniref:S66 peptidase family protein n=1 Tax=Paenibacillus urinalis TaxID=521520 RepID=UPI00196195E9